MRWRTYWGWFGPQARRRCPHSFITGVYGDEVHRNGRYRLHCIGCDRLLDGPVSLAQTRRGEL